MATRLIALVRKELLALVRDPRGRMVLIMPPLLQMVIFAFAVTLEVKDNTLTVLNQDNGAQAAELVNRLTRIGAFRDIRYVHDEQALTDDIDGQRALIALRIPADFSRKLLNGESVSVQAVVDGRRSNSGQIALGYVTQIATDYGLELAADQFSQRNPNIGSSIVVTHHRYNVNLHYLWFTVPGLVMMLTTLVTMIVTALSVARERELGTFDQLLVSPYSPTQILLGKAIPAYMVALLEGAVIITVGTLLYGVPFRGSLFLLWLSLSAYLISLIGVGLFISSICHTQQQAILGVFSFLLPSILLSGYASPIDNMPKFLQWATLANPLRHFFVIVKGIFLKAMEPGMVWDKTWPLLIIACFTLAAANWLFRRKLG